MGVQIYSRKLEPEVSRIPIGRVAATPEARPAGRVGPRFRQSLVNLAPGVSLVMRGQGTPRQPKEVCSLL